MYIKFLIIFFIFSSLFGRSWQDIKNSEQIELSILMLDNINNENTLINKFQIELFADFAASYKLNPVIKENKLPLDYSAILEWEKQFGEMDVLNQFRDPFLFLPYLDFIDIFYTTDVCIYLKKTRINIINDLISKKGIYLNNCNTEKIIKDLNNDNNFSLILDKETSLNNLHKKIQDNKYDYAILNAEIAALLQMRNKQILINTKILSNYALLKPVSWIINSSQTDLKQKIIHYLDLNKQKNEYYRLWEQSFNFSYEKHLENLEPIQNKGKQYFKKALYNYTLGSYTNSLKFLKEAGSRTIDHQKIDNLYDSIFLNWVSSSISNQNGNITEIIDYYIKENPSTNGIRKLQMNYADQYYDYKEMLLEQKENFLNIKSLSNALYYQNLIFRLESDSVSEKNELKKIKIQFEQSIKEAAEVSNIAVTDDEEQFASYLTNTDAHSNFINIIATNEYSNIINREGERFFDLGFQQYSNKNYNAALEAFQNSIVLDFNTNQAVQQIMNIKILLSNQIMEVEQRKKNTFQSNFNQAVEEYLKDNYQNALNYISAALSVYPENKNARKYFSIISDQIQLIGETEVNKLSPYYEYYMSRINEAEHYQKKNDLVTARTIYEEILLVFPHNLYAKQELAVCLLSTDPEKYNSILENYFMQAVNYYNSKKYKRALIQFKLVQGIDSDYPELQKYLNLCNEKNNQIKNITYLSNKEYLQMINDAQRLYSEGELHKSLKKYQDILAVYPNDYKSIVNSARIEIEINSEFNESSVDLMKSDQRIEAEKLYLSGRYYFRLQEYETALKYWKESYRVDPTYAKVKIDILRLKKYLEE